MAEKPQKVAAHANPEEISYGKSRPCPICEEPSVYQYRPFCSRRCADIDLSRWMTGKYAVAGGDADEDEDGDQARAADAVRSIDRNDRDA